MAPIRENLEVYCIKCFGKGKGKKKPKIFKDAVEHENGRIYSRKLCEHITSTKECRSFYNNRPYLGGRLNHRSSLLKFCRHRDIQRDLQRELRGIELGVTNIPGNKNLQSQVTLDPFVPTMDRQFLDEMLNESFDDTTADDGWMPHGYDTDASGEDLDDGSNMGTSSGDEDEHSFHDNDSNDSSDGEEGKEEEGKEERSSTLPPPESITTPNHQRYVTDDLRVKLKLMKIMRQHNIPLKAEREIIDWAYHAHRMTCFNWNVAGELLMTNRDTTMKHFYKAVPELSKNEFEPQLIDWHIKPTEKVRNGITKKQVYIRSFRKALKSLLTNADLVKEDNLSFPNKETPLSPEDNPPLNPKETVVTELHHGSWWYESWKKMCHEGKNEILVPVILYMDGISLDNHQRLSIEPLNMTLGIFSNLTRATRPDAWETLYFHPQAAKNEGSPLNNLVNLHTGLRAALESFKEASELPDGIGYSNLQWNGKRWSVRMKFCISLFVGDTVIHDQLTGHYNSRDPEKVKMICRHCSCLSEHIVTSRKNVGSDVPKDLKLWKPCDLDNPTLENGETEEQYFKRISHHRIRNAFHDLNFGANEHNIHIASPGEKLHMHQLGCEKRACETFNDDFLAVSGHKAKLKASMNRLTRHYGALISRQSDRDFPRTQFSESMDTTKKEGNHFGGMVLIQMIALRSEAGRKLLESKVGMDAIQKRIYVLELILGMEEFLKYSATKCELRQLPKMVVHFVDNINNHLRRRTGAGNKLIKNHMYFHLPKYIEMFGSPAAWDSSASESNHKTEIKAPANRTQVIKSLLIKQTCHRQTEYRNIDRLDREFDMYGGKCNKKEIPGDEGWAGGSRFQIRKDAAGSPYMKWDKKKNEDNGVPHHPSTILQFCCDHVLPAIDGDILHGFTEHQRYNEDEKRKIMFRAHPSYYSNTGQTDKVWYDWAVFNIHLAESESSANRGEYSTRQYACQILCFLHLEGPFTGKRVQNFRVNSPGYYAVVRRLKFPMKEPEEMFQYKLNAPSSFVWECEVHDRLYLFKCDEICEEVAVIPNIGSANQAKHFVLGNRGHWLDSFRQRMSAFANKSIGQVIREGERDAPPRGRVQGN